ncbi:MAG: PIN domain-containing protein [Phormidium sp.]
MPCPYALLINIFRPEDSGFDTVKLTEIPLFNPNKCLTLADDKNFIGQTFLITAYLSIAKPDKPEKLRSHAEKLLKQLLGDSYPDFYEADEFLDGYILEFSRPRSLQTRVMVLFYFSNTTSEQLRKIYFDLPELFLYYHKITHVYIAISITEKSNLIISTQVINEISVNLIKKAKFDENQIKTVIQSLYNRCQVVEFDLNILESAADLRTQYNLSFWDSLIVACALAANASILYSEDLQNGLVITKQLNIINPFQ